MDACTAASAATVPGFCVIGHRGNCALAPENTLASFELALESGTAFETDVQMTADGVVMVIHDERLNKTTNGSGPVCEAQWEHVSQLDAGAWFGESFSGCRVPSLAQLLDTFRNRAHIHLELKSSQPALPAAVQRELERSGWLSDLRQAHPGPDHNPDTGAAHRDSLDCVPGLTITSFHLPQLQRSIELLPDIPHGWLIQEITQPTLEAAAHAGVRQICPRVDACSRELVAQALDAGFTSVRGWGVRSKELLRHAAACGMHGATVNWPHEATVL